MADCDVPQDSLAKRVEVTFAKASQLRAKSNSGTKCQRRQHHTTHEFPHRPSMQAARFFSETHSAPSWFPEDYQALILAVTQVRRVRI